MTGLVFNPVHPRSYGHSKSGSDSMGTEIKGVGVKNGLKEFRIKLSNTGYPPLPSHPPSSNSTLSTDKLYPPINSRRSQNISSATNATTATTSTLSSLISTSSTPFVLSVRKQRSTYQQAFTRHSWNRVDLLAVTSFWICFTLAMFGVEAGHNLYLFRALSVLRATRLLAVTAGTTVSLTISSPTALLF